MTSTDNKMLSTIAKDTLPETLCDETLAELERQRDSKIYTERIDVFWSPDIALAEMKTKLELFGSVKIRDLRKRPYYHIDENTKLPYTDNKLKEECDAGKKRLQMIRQIRWNKETTKEIKDKLYQDEQREEEQQRRWCNMDRHLRDWKPIRMVVACVDLNQHKKAKYQEIAGKYPDDVFVQQIWSCIRQRCDLMEEANKGRKNPMRNIGIELTFTPRETYFVASWDIDRWKIGEMWGTTITYHTNCSEYRLDPDGQVVEFKSEVTMNIEHRARQDAERKAEQKRVEDEEKQKKKDEELAGLTHHVDEWGHPYSQKEKKKLTAVYDDIWVLDPPDALRKNWEDRVAVLTMQGRTYADFFIGRRVVDTATHSIFSLIGFKHHYLVPSNVFGKQFDTIEETLYFPEPIVFQLNKGKTGKYSNQNKTKQLRVVEKIDLKDFPKA